MIVGPEDFGPDIRPPCPECGGDHIESSGADWMCRDCGRKFRKIRRPVEKKPPSPFCPRCGSYNCIKNGTIRLLCKDCGRTFNRI